VRRATEGQEDATVVLVTDQTTLFGTPCREYNLKVVRFDVDKTQGEASLEANPNPQRLPFLAHVVCAGGLPLRALKLTSPHSRAVVEVH
jgi:hypothetical protein